MALAAFKSITNRLLSLTDRVASPELAQVLGRALADEVVSEYFSTGMTVDSGNVLEWLNYVGEPQRVALGWRIGVIGNPSKKGGGPAPKGTIGAFLKWYGKQAKKNNWPRYKIRGGVPSRLAWRMLAQFQKEELQRQRLAGQFGGETAAAAGKVPYVYLHEYGKESATIRGRHFIERGRRRWQQRVPELIRAFYASR